MHMYNIDPLRIHIRIYPTKYKYIFFCSKLVIRLDYALPIFMVLSIKNACSKAIKITSQVFYIDVSDFTQQQKNLFHEYLGIFLKCTITFSEDHLAICKKFCCIASIWRHMTMYIIGIFFVIFVCNGISFSRKYFFRRLLLVAVGDTGTKVHKTNNNFLHDNTSSQTYL